MQKVWLCTCVCWALAIHHRTLVSFHFDFSKIVSPLLQLFRKPPRKPSPHTPLLHRENPSQIPLSFECWNPKLLFEKPYPILFFKIFPLSQIPLNLWTNDNKIRATSRFQNRSSCISHSPRRPSVSECVCREKR